MSTVSPVTSRLEVEPGVSLHLEVVAGPTASTRRPVLLVNGLTMSSSAWEPLTLLLTPERTVMRYDMRGQGRSDAPPGPYLRERHTLDLLAVLAELRRVGLAPVHIVALSNGAFVSQLVAAHLSAPELLGLAGGASLAGGGSPSESIASLTLLDTFAFVDAHLVAVLRSWLNALSLGGTSARFDAATPWVWGPHFLSERQDALDAARQLAAEQSPEPVRALTEGLLLEADQPLDLGPALHRFEAPLLVALGEDDALTPLRTNRQALALFGRGGDPTVIERAGHALPIENPSALAQLLRPVLKAGDDKASQRSTSHEGGAPP